MRYLTSDVDFIEAVKNNFSISATLRALGLNEYGSAYKIFKLRVKKLNIDTTHFTGRGWLKDKKNFSNKKIDLLEILIKDSNKLLSKSHRFRILNSGLLGSSCAKCNLKNEWMGEPIKLQIDHINGDSFDHRLSNLRLLCPNCHSQTQTFCGRNRKKITKVKKPIQKIVNKCKLCQIVLISSKTKYCLECYRSKRLSINVNVLHKTKINWPSIESILQSLENMSFSALGRELGVSGNAIRKFLKRNNSDL